MTYFVQTIPGGTRFCVKPGDNILDAAIASKISLPYSCRNGLCGVCTGRLVEGKIRDEGEHAGLNEAGRARGEILLCVAHPESDCKIEVTESPFAGTVPERIPAKIVSIEKVTEDIAVVQLRLPMNKKLSFSAGQYVDVLLETGERRSYSIASQPLSNGRTDLELHIRHVNGGKFTDRLFGPGARPRMLALEAPLGSFSIRSDHNGPILMLATGTGFAPVQSMVEDAIATGLTASRPIRIYWGAKTITELYRLEYARAWEQRDSNVKVIPVLSGEPDGNWDGAQGYVTAAAMKDIPDMQEFQVFACGSPSMVKTARSEFTSRCGLDFRNFFADAFLTSADMVGSEGGLREIGAA